MDFQRQQQTTKLYQNKNISEQSLVNEFGQSQTDNNFMPNKQENQINLNNNLDLQQIQQKHKLLKSKQTRIVSQKSQINNQTGDLNKKVFYQGHYNLRLFKDSSFEHTTSFEQRNIETSRIAFPSIDKTKINLGIKSARKELLQTKMNIDAELLTIDSNKKRIYNQNIRNNSSINESSNYKYIKPIIKSTSNRIIHIQLNDILSCHDQKKQNNMTKLSSIQIKLPQDQSNMSNLNLYDQKSQIFGLRTKCTNQTTIKTNLNKNFQEIIQSQTPQFQYEQKQKSPDRIQSLNQQINYQLFQNQNNLQKKKQFQRNKIYKSYIQQKRSFDKNLSDKKKQIFSPIKFQLKCHNGFQKSIYELGIQNQNQEIDSNTINKYQLSSNYKKCLKSERKKTKNNSFQGESEINNINKNCSENDSFNVNKYKFNRDIEIDDQNEDLQEIEFDKQQLQLLQKFRYKYSKIKNQIDLDSQQTYNETFKQIESGILNTSQQDDCDPNDLSFQKQNIIFQLKSIDKKIKSFYSIDQEDQEAEDKLVDNYFNWQKNLWKVLQQKKIEKEQTETVNKSIEYNNMYNKFKEKFMQNYLIIFDLISNQQQQSIESLWIEDDKKKVEDLKSKIKYQLNIKNISKDNFIQKILLIKQVQEKEDRYFNKDKNQIDTFDNNNDAKFSQFLKESQFWEDILQEKDQKLNIDQHKKIQTNQTKIVQKNIKHELEAKNQQNDDLQSYTNKQNINSSVQISEQIPTQENFQNKLYFIDDILQQQKVDQISNSISSMSYLIQGICFMNNKMDGLQFSQILSSFTKSQQQQINSIIYGGENSISNQYLNSLMQMLTSNNLQELKLIQVKQNGGAIQSILDQIKVHMRLKSLCLSKVNLDQQNVDTIADIINQNCEQLKSIDISCNKITVYKMQTIFEALKNNSYLENVNLSFNTISKSNKLRELGFFFKNNPNLKHIDLSGVLQTSQQVKKIIKNSKKSYSILSIHLNYIPCIILDLELQLYILKKLSIENYQKNDKYMSFKLDNNEAKEIENIIDKKFKYKLTQQSKIQAKEINFYQRQLIQDFYEENKNNYFIVQRTLAHPEIIGNKQWMIQKECYICNRSKYTLFVVQEQYEKQKLKIKGSFISLHQQYYECQLTKVQQIAMNLFQTSGNTDVDTQNYVNILPKEKRLQIKQDSLMLQKIKNQIINNDISLYDDVQIWGKILQEELQFNNCFPRQNQFDLNKYIDQLNNNESSSNNDSLENKQLYIFADYIKPNKRIEQYQIIDEQQNEVIVDEFFIPQVRQQDVPTFNYILKEKQKVQKLDVKFQKYQSVFKHWIEDSPQILKKCLQFDLQYWRVQSFVKDPLDLLNVIQIIKDNYSELKLIFLYLSCLGTHYPYVGSKNFCKFCVDFKIKDESIEQQTIDRMFIATKALTFQDSKNQLARHEFFECLIRISEKKYYETNLANNFADSLQLILNDMLKFQGDLWQEFRDQQLWNTLTDKLFTKNQNLIIIVYKEIFPKYVFNGFQNCIDFILNRTKLKITDKEIKYAYGLSKMTIKDMVTNIDNFYRLQYVEFLEFIARLGKQIYENEEISLVQKILRVLDELFRAIKIRRQNFIEEDRSSSNENSSSDESCIIKNQEFTQFKAQQSISERIL